MIELHQFPGNKRTRNFSPYCLKLETYLRMTGVPYKVVEQTNPRKAPKGKLPYIVDAGTKIPDSTHAIEYLKEKFGHSVDAGLDAGTRNEALALQRLMEDHLIFVLMYSRWWDEKGWPSFRESVFGHLPFPLKAFVPSLIKKNMKKILHAQGMGRHHAEEVYQAGKADLDALSSFLADKEYFLGKNPTSLDAVAFGFLKNIADDVVDSPLKQHAATLKNLVAYCERMDKRFFKSA